LVGDIDYDADLGKIAAVADNRSDRPATRFGVEQKYRAIKNSAAEMDGVKAQFLNAFPDARIKILTGAEASKEAFVEEASHHRWQHLVTHGFFATVPPQLMDAGPRFVGSLLASAGEDPGQWNPALMSGLAFAGANRQAWPNNRDGILTALTASEMDLREVELLSLAACDTGLGKVADGEGGVLGLQRAFHLAGARSVVASYWGVGDRPTREFVIEFYRNLWNRKIKLSKLEAFQKAQVWMIETFTPSQEEQGRGPRERQGKPLDPESARPFFKGDGLPPFYWAGFVLSGDWR
jgi:CHAT domain-containing protein